MAGLKREKKLAESGVLTKNANMYNTRKKDLGWKIGVDVGSFRDPESEAMVAASLEVSWSPAAGSWLLFPK